MLGRWADANVALVGHGTVLLSFVAHVADVALLARVLGQVVGMLPLEAGQDGDPPCRAVVRACAAQMERSGPGRIEYVVLALHAAECGLPEDGGLF